MKTRVEWLVKVTWLTGNTFYASAPGPYWEAFGYFRRCCCNTAVKKVELLKEVTHTTVVRKVVK